MEIYHKVNRSLVFAFFFVYSLSASAQVFEKFNGEFVGGFNGADTNSFLFYNNQITAKNRTVVKNTREFLHALAAAKDGDFIYLNSDGIFDFTGLKKIPIPKRLTIYSDRGRNKSSGALVFTNTLDTSPLFSTESPGIVIFGIRFRGPDGHFVNSQALAKQRAYLKKTRPDIKTSGSRFRVYGVPNSNFLEVKYSGILIENCEIYNWSHAGVFVKQGGVATVKHSYIHHNQRTGLGYGITVDKGTAIIEGNLFDFNRHSIAGTGAPGSNYRAEGNIAFGNHSSHIFDMHGGRARNDGTNVAGDQITIRRNIFYVDKYPAVQVRGVPTEFCSISENTIIYQGSEEVKSNGVTLYRQTNGKGRFSVFNNSIIRAAK